MNDMVVCGRIVAASEQWVWLVMYEGRRTEAYRFTLLCASSVFKVTVDLRGVFWEKQYSALCINGEYINLYIIGELI